MSAKLHRISHGPGWIEVILGALLSLILGAVVGAALLVARPVVTAKDTPKEADRDPKAVYYVQGARDPSKSRSALAKRKAFGEGQSVTLAEDELNALAALTPAVLASPGAETPPPAPKKADATKPAESATPTVSSGVLNFSFSAAKSSYNSGSYCSIAAIMFLTFQLKIYTQVFLIHGWPLYPIPFNFILILNVFI